MVSQASVKKLWKKPRIKAAIQENQRNFSDLLHLQAQKTQ
jgi:hypothetical protein